MCSRTALNYQLKPPLLAGFLLQPACSPFQPTPAPQTGGDPIVPKDNPEFMVAWSGWLVIRSVLGIGSGMAYRYRAKAKRLGTGV